MRAEDARGRGHEREGSCRCLRKIRFVNWFVKLNEERPRAGENKGVGREGIRKRGAMDSGRETR